MAYATYKQYTALYGETLDKAAFDRLAWEAERVMDRLTTGVDGVRKLRVAFPTDEGAAQAVKRCACGLVELQWKIQQAEEAARKAQGYIENADGTVQSKVIASKSAGSESITYATGSAARGSTTAVDAAVNDPAARTRLLADTVRDYLSGVPDANGVNLTYMGRYPVRQGAV